MGLELRADEIGPVGVHRVDGNEAIRVGRDYVSVRLELHAGDMGTRRLLNDVCSLEEAILAPVPEGQVATTMGDDEVIVQWVERRPRQSLLQGL